MRIGESQEVCRYEMSWTGKSGVIEVLVTKDVVLNMFRN